MASKEEKKKKNFRDSMVPDIGPQDRRTDTGAVWDQKKKNRQNPIFLMVSCRKTTGSGKIGCFPVVKRNEVFLWDQEKNAKNPIFLMVSCHKTPGSGKIRPFSCCKK